MRKLLCLVLGCMLLCASFGALAEVSPTEAPTVVRGVKWGMTAEEIIALEGREPDRQETDSEGNPRVTFDNVTAGGLPATVFYTFNEAGGCYLITYNLRYLFQSVDMEDYNIFTEDYTSLKKALITKYGEPTLNEENWEEGTNGENPAQVRLTAANERLSGKTEFETENVHIYLAMMGSPSGEEAYRVYLLLEYSETIPAEPIATSEPTAPPRTVVLDGTL
jgi:hypothetical protein